MKLIAPAATPLVLLFALLTALTSCSGGPGPDEGVRPRHPDLSGTWILNFEESEDPRAQMQRDRPPPPGARPGAPPRVNPQGMRTPMRAILQGQLAFKLVQADSTVTFAAVEGTELVCYTDGRWEEQSVEGLGDVRVRARWKGKKLVLDRELEYDLKISQTYELASDGRQLYVKVKVSGGPRTIEFRRVYDAKVEDS